MEGMTGGRNRDEEWLKSYCNASPEEIKDVLTQTTLLVTTLKQVITGCGAAHGRKNVFQRAFAAKNGRCFIDNLWILMVFHSLFRRKQQRHASFHVQLKKFGFIFFFIRGQLKINLT